MLEKAEKGIRRPAPVTGITKAIESREFFYNPSITVPFDLKDHKRRIFHKKGTRINPLTYRSLRQSLILIDGDDEKQVAWAFRHIKAKIILTSGSPFDLMESWNGPVYFDQGGRLTSKLGIRHVPAVVTQEGLQLKILEVMLEERP
jgi:conjugal transfer pilus assembly protein TraW